MQTSQRLRNILQNVTVTDRFEQKGALALVNILVDKADRLAQLERLNEVPGRDSKR